MARRQVSSGEATEAPANVAERQDVGVDPNEILYDVYVPEILIDGITTASVVNGILRLNLVSVQQTGPSTQQPRVVLRLAISLSSFPYFQEAINRLAEGFRDAGKKS